MRRTVTALLAALLLTPVLPAEAAPPACSPSGSLELVGGGAGVLVAGQEHVQGYVLRRRLGGGATCAVPGATVELLARVANTATTTVVRTGTTDADGRVQFRVRPPYTVVLSARSVADRGYAATSSTQVVHEVSTRVTLARRALDGCREAVSGRTYPAKPGTPVHISDGDRELGRFAVRSDGTWSGTVRCGDRALFASIHSTARNAYGSSHLPGPLATRTTTCGQARTSSGVVGSALMHVFEPFNLTSAPHGRWWGERVVANRTDRTLTFQAYSTDTYQTLRRGTATLVGGSGFTDAVGVSNHTLAPGEELREVISMSTGNCFASVPPGSATLGSSPGPAFPAGTAVAAQSLLRTDQGWSVSNRVALTVS